MKTDTRSGATDLFVALKAVRGVTKRRRGNGKYAAGWWRGPRGNKGFSGTFKRLARVSWDEQRSR